MGRKKTLRCGSTSYTLGTWFGRTEKESIKREVTAQEIRQAFGDCSIVYEAYGTEEVTEGVRRTSVQEFCRIMLNTERIHLERRLYGYEIDEVHRQVLEEGKAFIAAMEARLRKAGFLDRRRKFQLV